MAKAAKPKKKIAKWTILMQISAESNLFNDMMEVVEELYSVKNNPDVNFLVLLDGIDGQKFSKDFAFPAVYKINGETNFILDNPALPEIEKDGKFPHFDDDLSNEETLIKIFKDVKANYPAKRYGYIYKGHGGPAAGDVTNNIFMTKIAILPKKLLAENVSAEKADANEAKIRELVEDLASNFSFNSTFEVFGFTQDNENKEVVGIIFQKKLEENTDFLTHKTISNVLRKVFGKKGLEFIFLDCCWGMQLENLYSFRECTKNFVASADEMPAAGIGYDLFYSKISERATISGDEIADLLVAVYYVNKYDDYDSPNPDFRKMGVSLTHADTEKTKLLTTRIKTLCSFLGKNISQFSPVLKAARECCKDYTYTEDANVYAIYNIDFLWFLESLQFANSKLTKDAKLDGLIKDVVTHISVETRKGFLASNYAKPVPGKRELGGRGFTITFPEEQGQIANSIFALEDNDKPDFLKDSGWEKLITKYFDSRTELIATGDPASVSVRSLSASRVEEESSKWGKVIRIRPRN